MDSRPNVLKEFGGRFDLTTAGLPNGRKEPWYVRAWSHLAKASPRALIHIGKIQHPTSRDSDVGADLNPLRERLTTTNTSSSQSTTHPPQKSGYDRGTGKFTIKK